MEIETFQKVKGQGYSFNQIFDIYDKQFQAIHDFLLSLGDKYIVEDIPNSNSTTITLNHSYCSGQMFLYINGVIQWKDIDYEETTSTIITLLKPRESKDVVKVVIIKSNVMQDEVKNYIGDLQSKLDTIQKLYSSALLISNTFKELYDRLEQRKHYYTNDEVQNALLALESSTKSAKESEQSAKNAETQATNSATSAKNAETQATECALQAKNSISDVQSYLDEAKTQATNAKQSADDSANYLRKIQAIYDDIDTGGNTNIVAPKWTELKTPLSYSNNSIRKLLQKNNAIINALQQTNNTSENSSGNLETQPLGIDYRLENLDSNNSNKDTEEYYTKDEVDTIIQEKINALKEELKPKRKITTPRRKRVKKNNE